MRLDDLTRLDDGGDDRLQCAPLPPFAKAIERLALRAPQDARGPGVSVGRPPGIAPPLHDRSGRTAFSHAGEARGEQTMACTIGNSVERALKLPHRSGDAVALLTVEHDLDTEVT